MSDRTALGRVVVWHREEGWGVIELDGDGLPVWAHSSTVTQAGDGFRELHGGERVLCHYSVPGQAGSPARAVSVVRAASDDAASDDAASERAG